MKNFKLINYLLIAASSLVFMQCTSDYQTIKGDPGTDGTNGIDGVDGVDGVGVQACIDCHSSAYRDDIHTQYTMSHHYGPDGNGVDGSWARGTSGSCARCHNNAGFQDLFSGRFVELDANDDPIIDVLGKEIPSADPDGYLASSPISCTGCHDSEAGHRNFDFAEPGSTTLNDYALRTLDPVYLIIDRSISIDVDNSSDPMGYSNTCINCHQPRTPAPTPNAFGNYAVTSTHWGPHHGPQGTFLYGLGGAILPGAMPAVGDATHAKGASCVACHMGEPSEADNGGHTWNPTENACLTCHTSGPPSEVAGLQDMRDELLTLLQTKGLDSTGTKYIFNASGGLQTGTYPVKVAQAAFNYIMLEEDRSDGVHNPEYAKDLIQNSIDAIQN